MITLTTLPALAFPVIDPVLIEIGPFAIRWYALAYIAGLVGGWWYVRRLVQRPQLWPQDGAPYTAGGHRRFPDLGNARRHYRRSAGLCCLLRARPVPG
jgi:hypothetical protein